MTEDDAPQQSEGVGVYFITYDEEGNEERLLPAEMPDDVVDTSRNFGIGKGRRLILRIKHGPLVAAESELRTTNVGSLGRAIADNYFGTSLIVDRSAPPIDDDVMDVERRYTIDMHDGRVVAIVRQRYARQPPQTPTEISASLTRVAAAYNCEIADVVFTLPGGGTPEETLADWPADEEWAASFRSDTIQNLAMRAHDVNVYVATDNLRSMDVLLSGAAAVADLFAAIHDGPLNATAVLNLLRASHFEALLGEVESGYLEVKTAMHSIGVAGPTGEKAKIELAQDVARFANGNVDAVLVIGYREAPGGDNEIGTLTPVKDSAFNLGQIQNVLDSRIVPPVDGLLIEKFAASSTKSVLAIYVPRQPAEMQPYLVHGAIMEDKVEGAFFSIVRRRGEGSITTSAQQIHAYIVAGKRYLRGDS